MSLGANWVKVNLMTELNAVNLHCNTIIVHFIMQESDFKFRLLNEVTPDNNVKFSLGNTSLARRPNPITALTALDLYCNANNLCILIRGQ